MGTPTRHGVFVAFAVVLAGFATAAAPVRAVEIRDTHKKSLYQAAFTRAYAPCLAPNDQTPEGIPACSPPVSSVCGFKSGHVDVRAISGEPTVMVSSQISKLTGPGPCTTGVYTLRLSLRATADDPACAGGSCTFSDVVVSKPLVRSGKNAAKVDFSLADVLPSGFGAANLQILTAAIADPNGVDLATSGAATGKSNLTVADARCDAPNTAGALGPACAPPVYEPVCDFEVATLQWHRSKMGAFFMAPRAGAVVGAAPCGTGTYHVDANLRITTARCGDGTVPCTYVDTPISLPATAEKGSLEAKTSIDTTGIVRLLGNVELRDIRLSDPSGAALGATGVGYARRLRKPHVVVARRTLANPTDDALRVDAEFPPAALDPSAGAGVTITVHDSDGVFYAATVPAAAWHDAAPMHWTFKDKNGAIAGIRRADIHGFNRSHKLAGFKIGFVVAGVALGAADRPSVTLELSVAEAGGAGVVTAARNKVCKLKKTGLTCR